MPDRGEVWLADLDPRRGTEPGKTRPVLIVQSQALLEAGHPSTLIAPLTTTLIEDAEPRAVAGCDVLIDHLRAIDNRRLVSGPLCRAPEALMARVGGQSSTCSTW